MIREKFRAADLDAWCDEIRAEVTDLVSIPGADRLNPYIAPNGSVRLDKLITSATDEDRQVWQDTRPAHVRLEEILALWRARWRQVTIPPLPVPRHLRPRGWDVYAWERPELVSREQVRHGGRRVAGRLGRSVAGQLGATAKFVRAPIDVLAVAIEHPRAEFRLIGPSEAETILGPDGLVQEGHPCRVGVSKASPPYRRGVRTWTTSDGKIPRGVAWA